MQTLTFTQKLLRQRRFLSSLLPLIALFIGLGSMQTASAQSSTFGTRTVTVNAGSGPTTYNAVVNTATGTAAPTGEFDERNFGSFDINTGQLSLTGGSFTITENGGDTFSQGYLDYRIFTGTLSPASGTIPGSPTGSIQLIDNGVSGGVHSFSFSAASVDVIALVNAGTYRLDIDFRAVGNNIDGDPLTVSAGNRRSQFTVTGTRPVPSGATISNPTVTVDQGNGNVGYTAANFNNTLLADQKPGSTTTPAFDINTGQLILKGGTLTTTETGAAIVNGAFLDYVIYTPNFASTITTGTLQLTEQPGSAGGVRNFALSTGTTNLVTLVAGAANGYVVSISYHATYQTNGTGAPIRVNNNGANGSGYNATFNVTGTRTPAPTITANTISIAPNGNADVVYNINPNTPKPFQGANLSDPANGGTAYDVNNGQLRLNGTTVTTTEAGTNTISSVVLYYRTYLQGQAASAYQPITLTQSGSPINGVRTFVLNPSNGGNNPQPNLVATPAILGPGTYVFEIYYQANGFNSSTSSNFTILDPPTGTYTSTFTVTGTPIATTIWTGAKNDNWFDADNWSAGVPTASTNALIRDIGAGANVPYPNINSDIVVTTAAGAILYSNVGSGPAMALNLTMSGTSQASRSIMRLVAGKLKVYGNFNNTFDSYIQREGTIIEFAGADQGITGGSFVRVDISGGGTKTLAGLMTVSESLNFLTTGGANAGILKTDITQPTVSLVSLADRAPTNNNNGAQLTGETDNSFLYGFVRTIRQAVLVGETRTYGNIGMTLTFTGNNAPGNVEVTRNTVESYTPLNNKYGIRRIFGVRPSDPQTTTGGLTANMIFHYRDTETMNLNGPTTIIPGSSSIPESRLTIFVSSNSGNTFQLVGRDGPVDETNNNVTFTGVRTFATFTLGDVLNPLPVRLTAFDAKRLGNDALVTWQTASEVNSKGYDVQVSTNGTEFRTLTSIPSASPNSTKLTSYSYTDTESNKSGKRYYRLRQVDVDNKETFFSPVVVSFDGKAVATTLVAYPNPFNSSDELHVATQSTSAGKGLLLITDMTGRTISKQAVEISSGLTDLTVTGTGDLKAGLYLVKLTLPSGEVKNLKVQKQ